jgi:dienelactone hydrolase
MPTPRTIVAACLFALGIFTTILRATLGAEPTLAPLLTLHDGSEIQSATDWSRQREQIKSQWQSYLGNFPAEKVDLKVERLHSESFPEFTRHHMKYQVEQGVFTEGWLLLPNRAAGKLPAMVVFHQTTKTHAQQVAGIDASVPELMHGVQLAKQGYIVWCPRCFIFDDRFTYAECVKEMQCKHPDWTGMTRMTWDAMRAVDFLISLPEVDAERIGCLGHSLGAKQVLYAAAFDERYQVAIFSEGGIGRKFSNWEAPWYLGPRSQQADFTLEHHSLMALIAPRPFLLIGGNSADGDQSLPFITAVKPVFERLSAKDNLKFLNHQQGHRYPAEAQEEVAQFLHHHLKLSK